ncbi:hypothetical protein BDN72DRAFT_583079 [Pluteus cervinus]|uniref:Uncharacterized protein n=1 Tax=Pluteus cervinus TaxID=181527 RepID=A0ACD3AW52_9AGAR|nr:hypothetical protein BDN72DRAFT_583079 [Pluteus cervinus]
MPSIASKVKSLLTKQLVKDIPSSCDECNTTYPNQTQNSKSDENGRCRSHGLQALPTELGVDRIPWEIYELVIHLLRSDLPTLRSCCLVCYDWKAVSQPLLFQSLFRPRRLLTCPGFKFHTQVNCAVIHEQTNVVLYGTSNGIFWQCLSRANEPPIEVVNLEDVQQIDIISITGKVWVIFRTGKPCLV